MRHILICALREAYEAAEEAWGNAVYAEYKASRPANAVIQKPGWWKEAQ